MNKEGYKKTELGYLPLDWDVQKLGEIANNVTIGLVKTMTAHYCEQGVPLIRNSNIKEDKIDKENMVFLTYEFAEANENKKLKVGDIVTVHTGDIGTSAVIEKDMDGAHGFATLNTTVNPEIIYNYYLSKYFNSNMYKKQAMSFSTGDGRFNLNLKDFVNSLIPIPSLKEQQKIAEILSSVDAAIEKTQQVIAKTEEVKKGLMQQLLTKGIGHTEFKDSKIGQIPTTWEVKKFKEITDVLKCGVASTPTYVEKGVPFLSAQNVKKGKLRLEKYNFISEEYHEKLTKNVLPCRNDILLTRVGSNIGEAALVDIDFEFSVYVSLTHIRMNQGLDPMFYVYLLNSDKYQKLSKHNQYAGGGVQNLNVKVVEEFLMPIPPLEEQTKIVNILSSHDEKIVIESRKLENLNKVKQGLMQQLLTGQVRVKVD